MEAFEHFVAAALEPEGHVALRAPYLDILRPSTLSPLEQAGILTGVVAGVGGLLLGVLNWLHLRHESRPRLTVTFSVMTVIERAGGVGTSIEEGVGVVQVANVGKLPVVAAQVGLKTNGPKDLIVVSPLPLDEGAWPRELPPGHLCLLHYNLAQLTKHAMQCRFKRAMVISQVGQVFYGRKRDARQFQQQLLKDATSL